MIYLFYRDRSTELTPCGKRCAGQLPFSSGPLWAGQLCRGIGPGHLPCGGPGWGGCRCGAALPGSLGAANDVALVHVFFDLDDLGSESFTQQGVDDFLGYGHCGREGGGCLYWRAPSYYVPGGVHNPRKVLFRSQVADPPSPPPELPPPLNL